MACVNCFSEYLQLHRGAGGTPGNCYDRGLASTNLQRQHQLTVKVHPHSQTFFFKHSKCTGSLNIFDGEDGASNIFEKTWLDSLYQKYLTVFDVPVHLECLTKKLWLCGSSLTLVCLFVCLTRFRQFTLASVTVCLFLWVIATPPGSGRNGRKLLRSGTDIEQPSTATQCPLLVPISGLAHGLNALWILIKSHITESQPN